MIYLRLLPLLGALISTSVFAATFEVKLWEDKSQHYVLDSRLKLDDTPVEEEDFIRAAQVSTRVILIDPESWAPVEQRFTLKMEQGSPPSEYVVTPRAWVNNTELQRESDDIWWQPITWPVRPYAMNLSIKKPKPHGNYTLKERTNL